MISWETENESQTSLIIAEMLDAPLVFDIYDGKFQFWGLPLVVGQNEQVEVVAFASEIVSIYFLHLYI